VDINAFRKKQLISKKLESTSIQVFDLQYLYSLSTKDIKFFQTFGNKQKERFFSEIGMLLSAGVDLPTILNLSVSNTKNKLSGLYEKILLKISGGDNLASAMESTGKFNDFDCYSVLMGENTGELPNVFNKLCSYYNKRIIQTRKINSSLSYPGIVFVTTIGAVYFMLKFVVPMFSQTLVRFGGELPPLTSFIIKLSHNISVYFFIFLVALILLTIVYQKIKSKQAVQSFLSAFLLKIPYFGSIIYKTHLLQFTQALDLLLTSKVNIVESIDLARKIVKFYPLKIALDNIREDLQNGDFFYKTLEKQKYFDQSMITLVRIGEEINQLDKIFMQLSKQYENDLEYQSNILISILEPVMILLLAVIVAIILIAMYLPMFKIGSVIH
jgi:type IV pilus assembly protein PilC